MDYDITYLPKEEWKGTALPIQYTTKLYYDVDVKKTEQGFDLHIEKKEFDIAVTHGTEEGDYPDSLYADYRPHAFAWGVIEEGELIAAIETDIETWSNRLRVTDLWVKDEYQKQGIGRALMNVAKEQARLERRRALILETQSCNVNAVDFYLHEGFTLIGLDTCSYKNNDLQRKEVRLEMGWFPKKKQRLTRAEVEIRKESKKDWHEVELMTQHAFWNKHHLGCDEHYLVHKIRVDEAYLPEISSIAVKDGKVIGAILYTKAKIVNGENIHDILTFGPLCIEPEWQGCGVGELLLKETMELAKEAGYKGIVIYGEPDYYPRLGFKTCDHFDITTPDGKNFDAFMGIELIPGAMKDMKGKFYESEVFENLPTEEVEEYNKKFPVLKKIKYPSQWD